MSVLTRDEPSLPSVMTKKSYTFGSSTKDDFVRWIEERHSIYRKKEAGLPRPWTEDEILDEFKFTNVFRELDKGTIALRSMIDAPRTSSLKLDLFNVIWYRMFNRYEHATDIGYVFSFAELDGAIRHLDTKDKKLFTSAHMTVGRAGERKMVTMLDSLAKVYGAIFETCTHDRFYEELTKSTTLERAFRVLTKDFKFYGIGNFIGYEIVTDLRWTAILPNVTDRLTWANIGPGCRRGLDRLGMMDDMQSLQRLWVYVREFSKAHIKEHFEDDHTCESPYLDTWPPFELREIEHSLCEFDKYERTRTGAGRPRERYHG